MTIGKRIHKRHRRRINREPIDVGLALGWLVLIGIGWVAIISEMGMGVHQLIK